MLDCPRLSNALQLFYCPAGSTSGCGSWSRTILVGWPWSHFFGGGFLRFTSLAGIFHPTPSRPSSPAHLPNWARLPLWTHLPGFIHSPIVAYLPTWAHCPTWAYLPTWASLRTPAPQGGRCVTGAWDQVCDGGLGLHRIVVGGPCKVVATAVQPVWAALVHPQATRSGARTEVGLSPARALAGLDHRAVEQSGQGYDEALAGLLQEWRELKLEREVW